ncbi:MAG: hypothetical protein ILP11_04845 [Alphaproteobacteria bacterium]|nr:hypothetical protein [Alphaproteobacteria bacterium]
MTGTIELIDISEHEMADYIERAFSAASVKQMIREASNLFQSTELFRKFGNILQAYASATGDLSDQTINSLAKDLRENQAILRQADDKDTKLEGQQIYFGKYVMPRIIDIYVDKMEIKKPISLFDACKILAAVDANSHHNRFRTHSFNGALLPEIQKNGLDITKELFRDELAILASAGMTQPYQKGNLLLCELSAATFGYALQAPERLKISLTRPVEQQRDDQSTNEFLTQLLQANVSERTNLSDADKQKVFAAGKKMVDFYFGEHDKSAIAFIKEKPYDTPVNPSKYEERLGVHLSAFPVSMCLNSFFKKNNDLTMYEDYKKAVEAFKTNKDISKLCDFVDKFNTKYPNSDILKKTTKAFIIKQMTDFGLNHFSHNGNADGFKVDGGKLPRDKFALAVFDNPIAVYVQHQKNKGIMEQKRVAQLLFNNNG